jgi:hypothetical protein
MMELCKFFLQYFKIMLWVKVIHFSYMYKLYTLELKKLFYIINFLVLGCKFFNYGTIKLLGSTIQLLVALLGQI